MPANIRHQTLYVITGNPDTVNEATPYYGGQLGQRVTDTLGREYQYVKHDSGATSSTSVGVSAANQLAYWKDRTDYLVTNDSAQAIGGAGLGTSNFRNEVAGIYRNAVTAGNYCFVLQRGENINVKSASGTYVAGDFVVANTGTAADATVVAVGTAPTVKTIGTAAGARSGSNTPTDVDISQQE